MEILKFIAWSVRNTSTSDIILYLFIFWLVFLLLNLYLFGLVALIVFFGGIFLGIISFLLYGLYKRVMKNWEKYQVEKEYEAQVIVNRLKGQR